MTSLGNWLWGTSQLDDAIGKATSELLPAGTEDIALNLEISDQIRSKSVSPKDAMRSLKRRLDHKNPNVQLSALTLIDLCVKNGGDHFLMEIASKEFMDNLVSILKSPTINHQVKSNILRLIQNWSSSFQVKPSLIYAIQTYKLLKNEGFVFPPPDISATSSAMVDTQTAPEWTDSDVCMFCRDPFTFTNRKHHCRNCGKVFDQRCSSEVLPLPHFGITQEVRVCKECHVKLTKNRDRSHSVDLGNIDLQNTNPTHLRHSSARELADAELQRAIQLSLEEAGTSGALYHSGYVPSQPPAASEPPLVDRYRPNTMDDEDDPDLRAAIEASLREANAPKPSAPLTVELLPTETPRLHSQELQLSHTVQSQGQSLVLPNYDLDPLESDAIMTFSQTVEQAQTQSGRDITHYPALNQLYDHANNLRPKLVMSLDDTSKREQLLTEMHEKLSQAVRIYDNLLTEQVAHPPWRSTQLARSGSMQLARSGSPSFGRSGSLNGALPTNHYNQWSPPVAQIDAQQSWTTPQSPIIESSLVHGEQTWNYQSRPIEPQMQSSTPSRPLIFEPVIPQPPPIQAYGQSTSSAGQPSRAPMQPPPLPQHSRPVQSAPPTSFNRHGPTATPNVALPLSDTTTNSRATQQLPQRIYSTPPAPLPNFPIAPTSAPQSMFMPSVPSAVEQSDRHETLLIDL